MSTLPDLLRLRFDMVSQLSQATSRLQKFQQARMSAEMDVQRCEMAQELPDDCQPERDAALARAQAADEAIVDCETLIAQMEAELDETDRAIATLAERGASS